MVHSTRHRPLELGKDIIAVDRKGTPCAFQLKGNPGGYLTTKQFATLVPQLTELVQYAISWPGMPNRRHRSFLVTNGRLDEEATIALQRLNEQFRRQRLGGQIEVIQRDNIREWAVSLGNGLWPSELEDINALLELMVANGSGILPLEKLGQVLSSMLGLRQRSLKGSDEVRRRIAAAAVVVETALHSFSQGENHVARIAAWTAYVAHCECACRRAGLSWKTIMPESIVAAEGAVLESLALLLDEVKGMQVPGVGSIMQDYPFLRGRTTLIVSLLCLYSVWGKVRNGDAPADIEPLGAVIARWRKEIELWGEGAVPQFLCLYWYLRCAQPSSNPDALLDQLCEEVITRNGSESRNALPNPYYSFEQVKRRQLGLRFSDDRDSLVTEKFAGGSYYARPLFDCLVRRNLKHRCKQLWREYSRLRQYAFVPSESWMLSAWHAEEGDFEDRESAIQETWEGLREDALNENDSRFAGLYGTHPLFLALFLVFFPHRVSADLVRCLDLRVC